MTSLSLYELGAREGSDPFPFWDQAMARFRAEGGGRLVIDRRFECPPRPGPFCLDATADNVTLEITGAGALAQPVGMPARQVALLRINERRGWRIVGDGALDGNWGNAIGLLDDHTGINHETQSDPKSHLIAVRGAAGLLVEGVELRQAYGDGIWIGHGVDDNDPTTPATPSVDVVIRRVRSSMTARNGITFGGPCERVTVDACRWENPYACAIDFEPGGRVAWIDFVGGYAGNWWSHRDGANYAVVVDGGGDRFAEHVTFGGGFACDGSFMVQRARDVDVRRCRIATAWGGRSWAPVIVRWSASRIRFADNDVIDYNLPIQKTPTQNNQNTHAAAMHVDFYQAGTALAQPSEITFERNRIRAMGVHGIRVCGSSADLIENEIDLVASVAGVRGRGVDLFAEKPGMIVRAHRNRSTNPQGEHLRARFTTAANAMKLLDVSGEIVADAQDAKTATACVVLNSPRYVEAVEIADLWPAAGTPGVIGWP